MGYIKNQLLYSSECSVFTFIEWLKLLNLRDIHRDEQNGSTLKRKSNRRTESSCAIRITAIQRSKLKLNRKKNDSSLNKDLFIFTCYCVYKIPEVDWQNQFSYKKVDQLLDRIYAVPFNNWLKNWAKINRISRISLVSLCMSSTIDSFLMS